MAADYEQLSENLRRFYDFTDKVVLFVGAGGRQNERPSRMHKITPFLWFDHQAESAMNYYVSIFKNSKILTVNRANRKVMSGDVRTRRPTVHGPERQSEMYGVVPLCMAWVVCSSV